MNIKRTISYTVIGSSLIAMLSVGTFAASIYFGNVSDIAKPGENTGLGSGTFKSGGACDEIPHNPNDTTIGNIRAYIEQASDFFKLPPAFIAGVMKQESGFNPKAQSYVGAKGLMQLMPGTYQGLNQQSIKTTSEQIAKARGFIKEDKALRQVYISSFESIGSAPVTKLGTPNLDTDITNTKYNVFLGTAYYRQHYDDFSNKSVYHKAFSGDQLYRVMLAAYNAGPAAVDKYNDVPPYAETKQYVDAIMKNYATYSGCQVTTTSTSSGSTSNSAGKTLEDWVKNNPTQACQSTGKRQCAIADRDSLQAAFPGSNGSGVTGQWIPTDSSAIGTPSSSDLSQAQQILNNGNLPVWHIVGDVSGQHWVVVTGIEGSNVRFYDPASGTIETRAFDSASQRSGQSYFGITNQGGGDNSEGKRGYVFYPSGNPK